LGNGPIKKRMEEESRSGRMVQSTKAFGRTIRHNIKDVSIMQMEIFMKG
jgi:hypothetical protein